MNDDLIIDEMGSLFENFSVNPILGRIFGLLLSSTDPISLIDIAKKLELSKAAISINIRTLEQLGYCKKLPKNKDRQNFYVIKENYLENTYRIRIEKEISTINNFKYLITKNPSLSQISKKRVTEFIDFNNFIINEQLNSLNNWENKNDN